MVALTELYFIPTQTLNLGEWPIYGSSRVGIYKANKTLAVVEDNVITASTYQTRIKFRYNGKKQYELSNHLGNVLVTISDRRKAICNNVDSTLGHNAVVITANDYYSFGSVMVGRTYEGDTSKKYTYGFNGQEKVDEVSGSGNHNTALFWEYDTRLGRRWNVDPVVKPWESPYATFSNNPVLFIDPNGDDVVNGDRLVADKKKGAMERANNKLSDFKTNHKIGDDTKRKDFLADGGTKKEWKEYKSLRTQDRNATKEFNLWDGRANVTQGIIDQWKISSPNLFNEVDKQTTDFILTSFDFDPSTDNAFGATTPSYTGDAMNASASSSMKVRIAQQVNVSSVDVKTGEFSLNHEAGHFLYIVKFTAEYVRYYVETNKNGTYVRGGHGKTDESGKVATKYGNLKDIPLPAPVILPTGN